MGNEIAMIELTVATKASSALGGSTSSILNVEMFVVEICDRNKPLAVPDNYERAAAVPLEEADDVLHHGAVHHGDHRLGQRHRQRPKPRAETACHDDCFHSVSIEF